MNKANDFLNGIKGIGKYISDRYYLTLLKDTPTGYLGHSGHYLVVNDGEDGVGFTGIEKISKDLIEYGFLSSNVVTKYTDNIPSASENDGKLIASGCDLYYSCDGNWVPLKGTPDDTLRTIDIDNASLPACVETLDEYNQFVAYKDAFLSENISNSFMDAFNTDIDPLVIDVCTHVQSNLPNEFNTVKIDESSYKWGMFSSAQTINLSATEYSDDKGNQCTFQYWDSSNLSFADDQNKNTSTFVDEDCSITGYFECLLAAKVPLARELDLNIQATNSNTIIEKSTTNKSINNINGVTVSNSEQIFNTNTLNFTGASHIEVGNSNDFQFLHDGSSNYTVEFWTKPKNITTEIDPDAISGGSVGTWQYQYIEGTPLNLFDSDDSTHYSVRNIESTFWHPDFSIQLQVNFSSPIGNIDQIKWTFRVTECCGGRALYIKRASDGQWMTGVSGGSGGVTRTDIGDGPFPPFDAIKMVYNGRSTSYQQFYNFGVDFLVNALNPDLPTQEFNPVSSIDPFVSTSYNQTVPGLSIYSAGGIIKALMYNGSSTYSYSTQNSLIENQWNHVAVTFKDGKFYSHINGIYQGQTGNPFTNFSLESQEQKLLIGAANNGPANSAQFLKGYMQDVRVSRSAIYSDAGNFSPPANLF